MYAEWKRLLLQDKTARVRGGFFDNLDRLCFLHKHVPFGDNRYSNGHRDNACSLHSPPITLPVLVGPPPTIYIGMYRDISVCRYLPIFTDIPDISTDIYRYLPIFLIFLPIFTDIYRYSCYCNRYSPIFTDISDILLMSPI